MKPQLETLRFFAGRGQQGGAVPDVAREFSITDQAAEGRLVRLWRARLIVPVTPTPERRENPWSLGAGERIEDLRFQITRRGRERLEWARKAQRKPGDRWLF